MSISDYLELKLLGAVFNAASYVSASAWVSLHTAAVGEDGSNEATGGDYVRKSVVFDTAAAGAAENTNAIEWTGMPACNITDVGIWEASAAGNFLWGGALSASKAVNAGDTFQIAASGLDITLG